MILEAASQRSRTEAASSAPAIDPAHAALLAWLVLALVHAVVVWLKLGSPAGDARVRLLLHAYDLGQFTAAGLLSAGAVGAWASFGPRSAWAPWAALGAIAAALGVVVLRDDLVGVTGTAAVPSIGAA